MSWQDAMAITVFVMPMFVIVVGGTVLAVLELLSPKWYLYLKERREQRREAVKEEVRRATRGR